MMWGPWDGGAGATWMMPIAVLFLGFIVGGLILIARSSPSDRQPTSARGRNAALQILDERFARGEIDQAEYEERRRVLLGGG